MQTYYVKKKGKEKVYREMSDEKYNKYSLSSI